MTLEERAACIADQAAGTARGALRRKRVYDKALAMLREASEDRAHEVIDVRGIVRSSRRRA
jgi:hypothetical protein